MTVLHLEQGGALYGFKTSKTKCQRRVKAAALAPLGVDADCPECRAKADQEAESARDCVAELDRMGVPVSLADRAVLMSMRGDYRNRDPFAGTILERTQVSPAKAAGAQ